MRRVSAFLPLALLSIACSSDGLNVVSRPEPGSNGDAALESASKDAKNFDGDEDGADAGAPSAPYQVTAYPTTEGVYVRFAPPKNEGSSPIAAYTATTSSGQKATVTPVAIEYQGKTYDQLNCRVDIDGVPAGAAVTVTVTATNASGTGPASSESNAVTPTAYAPYFVADGGDESAENPGWGDYSFSGSAYYGVTPGTPSRNDTGGYAAPENPSNASDNVVEADSNAGTGVGFQPHVTHVFPTSNENGRFNLAPYKDLVFSVWPTADQSIVKQEIYVYMEKCLWVDGVVTASGTSTLTDATQNWPEDAFAGGAILDVVTGAKSGVASNTATTLTFDAPMATSPGDYYEISLSGVGIGQTLVLGNGGPSAYGPTALVSGQWNVYSVPLTAFNGGSGNYPTVAGDQILSFAVTLTALSGTDVHYFSNVGFE